MFFPQVFFGHPNHQGLGEAFGPKAENSEVEVSKTIGLQVSLLKATPVIPTIFRPKQTPPNLDDHEVTEAQVVACPVLRRLLPGRCRADGRPWVVLGKFSGLGSVFFYWPFW